MFLKSTNPPIIDKYPYTFENLRNDYPNTMFPLDYLSPDNEVLDDYYVYFIIDNPPELTATQLIISKLPIYNSDLNRFEFNYETREKTDDELFAERYNPVQFMKDLLANDLFNQWADTIPVKYFVILVTAFNNNSLDTLQSIYDTLKLQIPLPDNAQLQWQEIANNNGINIIF